LQAWEILLGDDITGAKKVRIYERIKVLKIKKTNKPVKPPISY